MHHWNILKKDEEGNKYDIRVIIRNGQLFIDDVGFIPKGKRKPTYIGSQLTNDYGWRALEWEGRKEAQKDAILKIVPESLLLEALTDVWSKLKPIEIGFY